MVSQWASDWRRTGGAVMTVAFVAMITWISACQTFVTTRNGETVHPSPFTWVLLVCVLVLVGGTYIVLSTYVSALPMIGKSDATDPHIELSVRSEVMFDQSREGDGALFNGPSALFVIVENTGRTATFSASISNVSGLERADFCRPLGDYFAKVAWEDLITDQQVIGYKSKATLLVMYTFTEPYAAWFLTPHSAHWSQGQQSHVKGWTLTPTGTVIRFTLTVVNETDMKAVTEGVYVRLLPDGTIVSGHLLDPTDPGPPDGPFLKGT